MRRNVYGVALLESLARAEVGYRLAWIWNAYLSG